MQKILCEDEMPIYIEFMDTQVAKYISEGNTFAFESFEKFCILSFDWYDIGSPEITTAKVLIYLDNDDLFIVCENSQTSAKIKVFFTPGLSNEKALTALFARLLKDDMGHLDKFETEIANTEDEALKVPSTDYLEKIVAYRKEALRLKRYYEQLDTIFDNLSMDESNLISKDSERHFLVLHNRVERFYRSALNIREYINQMREAYQSQIDIEQNKLMKIFTLIAAIFLPLTLLVGWYGMNFENMPELSWTYGYPSMVVFSIFICLFLIVYFKRKKWF